MKNIAIAFVHLGDHKANYLWSNIEQLIKRFPDQRVVLIYDTPGFVEGVEINGLEFFQYVRINQEQKKLNNQLVEMNFRKGYWRFTLERLISLHQFHATTSETGLLHVESDVLLLPEFPFNTLALKDKLMWCECDGIRDVASIVYSPNHASSFWLKEKILDQITADKFISDMEILLNIRKEYADLIETFPIIGSSCPNVFQGIFDGLNLGAWLTGIDPRNSFGCTKIRDTDLIKRSGTIVKPWNSGYEYSISNGLVAINENSKSRIWNLHIHSKNYKLLGKDWEEELIRFTEEAKGSRSNSEFNFGILVELIRTNFANRTLTRYLFGHPIFTLPRVILKGLKNL